MACIGDLLRNDDYYLKITPEERRKEFRALLSDAACPFLDGRTARFIDELELFLASGLNIEAYDRVYMHHLEMSTSHEESGQNNGAD
ncbi:hypothetical protein HPP92_025561 [Vanilla planifolia]|uniref:Uncharacterized protein n=1 Tax=Vanilla planifolia TaxID=51239 RepID=A0A835PJT5_VANPL|nr:hypothetical protein HPP92_025561 [Vanilla planifolia]